MSCWVQENDMKESEEFLSSGRNTDSNMTMKRNYMAPDDRKPKPVNVRKTTSGGVCIGPPSDSQLHLKRGCLLADTLRTSV